MKRKKKNKEPLTDSQISKLVFWGFILFWVTIILVALVWIPYGFTKGA